MSTCLDFAAEAALGPLDEMAYEAYRIISPLNPGYKEQRSTKVKEVATRIFYSLSMFVLAPLSIVCTPFALGGRSLARLVRGEADVIRGSVEAPAGRPRELSIMTYNIAFLFRVIAVRNGIKPPSERVDKIVRAILEQSADIVCLEEAFDEVLIRKIGKKLEETYPNQIYNVATKALGVGSGLAFFSKEHLPIESYRFQPHPRSGGDDKWANKGLLMTTIRLTEGERMRVYSTHLNGGAPEEGKLGGAVPRREQMAAICNRIRQDREEDPVLCDFFAGDFNWSPTDPDDGEEHAGMMPLIDPVYPPAINPDSKQDSSAFKQSDPRTGYDSDLESWPLGRHRQLDRIYRSEGPYEKTEEAYSRAEGGSDHLSLTVKYVLADD